MKKKKEEEEEEKVKTMLIMNSKYMFEVLCNLTCFFDHL